MDQTFRYLNNMQEVPSITSEGNPDKAPGLTPFKSALKLTLAQEDRLRDHCLLRIQQLINESGRSVITNNGDWYVSIANLPLDQWTFMGRRALFELTYQNKVEWRRWCYRGIFEQSNETAPVSRKICRQMLARACNYYWGTDPWFSATPIGAERHDLAEELEAFAQDKIDKSDLKSIMALALEGAIVRGEEVVKTVWINDEQPYQCVCNVLVDQNDQPILDVNGEPITDEDRFVPELTPEVLDQVTGIVQPRLPTGRTVLRRDMTTQEPTPKGFKQMQIERRNVKYRGPRSEIVYWKDMLVPGNAKDIQSCDCVAQLLDMPVMDIVNLYADRGITPETVDKYDETAQKALRIIRDMSGSGPLPKSAAAMAHPDVGENSSYVGLYSQETLVQIAEVYLKFDPFGDGFTRDIFVVLDRTNSNIIMYDYLANITPDGTRPFDVLRIQNVDGRWYGMGAIEMFETSQRAIDKNLNRIHVGISQAGRVTFWDPTAVLEGDNQNNLLLNLGQTYTLKPNKKAEDALSFVTLPEVRIEDLTKVMEFYIQLVTNEGGTANANDSAAAGLDTSKLATGVNNIKASGEEMTSLYMSTLLPSLTNILKRHIKLWVKYMNPEEVYTFFEGDAKKTALLLSEDVKDVDIDISILLTTYRGQQLLTSTQQAANLAAQFYQYPFQVQVRLAPLYRQLLKALKIDDADEVIQPIDPNQQAAPGQGNSPQAQGQPTPMGNPSNQAQTGGNTPQQQAGPQPSAPQINGRALLVQPQLASHGPEIQAGQ